MKWNKNAASQKGRVFRSGAVHRHAGGSVVLAVLLNLLVRAIPKIYTSSTSPRPKCTP